VPLTVFPAFNSLQMLAHRMQLPYERMRAVSVTGRPWDALDEALIQGEPLIG
jgi:precorrin-6Y C5,15-methyltransferase (decarboxylating)